LPMHRTTEQRRHSSTTPFLFCTLGSCKIWFKNRIRCLMDLENHQPLPSEFTHCSALRLQLGTDVSFPVGMWWRG
jgi:hypothetical protein